MIKRFTVPDGLDAVPERASVSRSTPNKVAREDPFEAVDRSRLDSSLQRWLRRNHDSLALVRWLNEMRLNGRDMTLEYLCRRSRGRYGRELWTLMEACQTVPERMLAEALVVVASSLDSTTVSYIVADRQLGLVGGEEHITIIPQADIRPYRPDFVLEYSALRPQRWKDRQGEWQEHPMLLTARMALEHDSWTWHEGKPLTRKAAEAKRVRIRDLQARGMILAPFLYDEVMDDVYGCAQEAINMLRELAAPETSVIDAA